jgi:hypothetical protein
MKLPGTKRSNSASPLLTAESHKPTRQQKFSRKLDTRLGEAATARIVAFPLAGKDDAVRAGASECILI